MAPYKSSNPGISRTPSKTDMENESNTIRSSFNGIFRYTGQRGQFHPTAEDWLQVKRRDDDIGRYWRVHDKLYDLTNFVQLHPGGADWIRFSQGTDITEAFESSHLVNVSNVHKTLAKYFVADAKVPRNSPYTFKENGFYKTLKRKAEPILKNVGMEPSPEAIKIQDSIFIAYISLAIIGTTINSTVIQICAGLALGMLTVGAHNFFHKKDNWRIFYYDLSPLSSYEWRITHAFSHHLYPNTILDYEVLLSEPMVEMLPTRPKTFVHKYITPFVIDSLYGAYGLVQVLVRLVAIARKKQSIRPENLLVFLELAILMIITPSAMVGLKAWIVIITAATFWFAFVSNNSAHHHPVCFHDGDEARPNPDFGLCQLDATAYKTDWYHRTLFSVLTTFGEHPLHHLFPTVCHGKLKHLQPILDETLQEFSEEVIKYTQWELFVGTHQNISRTTPNKFRSKSKAL